jgi:hypothetical protein
MERGAEILANSNWEILDCNPMLSSGVLGRFPDHETVGQRGEDLAQPPFRT